LGRIDERSEEGLFKYYAEIVARQKIGFPLDDLLKFHNALDVRNEMLTAPSQKKFNRKSFVSKKIIPNFDRFNIMICPCECMKDGKFYFWMKQLFVKCLQRIDFDSHYMFFTINNGLSERFGLLTNFKSDHDIPLVICSCNQSEFLVDLSSITTFSQEDIWNIKNLERQIIFSNGAGFAMQGRIFLKKLHNNWLFPSTEEH
jgi:hypothetical protein